jgi:hypothetical protein
MDFPSRPPFAADKPEGLIEALGGKKPKEIYAVAITFWFTIRKTIF